MSIIRKILLGLTGLTSLQAAKSQNFDLQRYAKEQTALQRNGMYVLAGWAGANIIGGAILTGQTSGTAQSFHRMNAYWNIVNGALAGATLFRLSKKPKDKNFATIYTRQQSLEKIFLLNAGLDVAYMAGGFYLKERSKTHPVKAAKLKGYGNSIILQGGFLLLFDAAMYGLLHHKGKKLDELLDRVQVSTNGAGLSLAVNL